MTSRSPSRRTRSPARSPTRTRRSPARQTRSPVRSPTRPRKLTNLPTDVHAHIGRFLPPEDLLAYTQTSKNLGAQKTVLRKESLARVQPKIEAMKRMRDKYAGIFYLLLKKAFIESSKKRWDEPVVASRKVGINSFTVDVSIDYGGDDSVLMVGFEVQDFFVDLRIDPINEKFYRSESSKPGSMPMYMQKLLHESVKRSMQLFVGDIAFFKKMMADARRTILEDNDYSHGRILRDVRKSNAKRIAAATKIATAWRGRKVR